MWLAHSLFHEAKGQSAINLERKMACLWPVWLLFIFCNCSLLLHCNIICKSHYEPICEQGSALNQGNVARRPLTKSSHFCSYFYLGFPSEKAALAYNNHSGPGYKAEFPNLSTADMGRLMFVVVVESGTL